MVLRLQLTQNYCYHCVLPIIQPVQYFLGCSSHFCVNILWWRAENVSINKLLQVPVYTHTHADRQTHIQTHKNDAMGRYKWIGLVSLWDKIFHFVLICTNCFTIGIIQLSDASIIPAGSLMWVYVPFNLYCYHPSPWPGQSLFYFLETVETWQGLISLLGCDKHGTLCFLVSRIWFHEYQSAV